MSAPLHPIFRHQQRQEGVVDIFIGNLTFSHQKLHLWLAIMIITETQRFVYSLLAQATRNCAQYADSNGCFSSHCTIQSALFECFFHSLD